MLNGKITYQQNLAINTYMKNIYSLVAHQNWFVPIFIKMFSHLKLLLDLIPIRIVW